MNTPHALCLATASFRPGRRNQRSNMLFLVVSLVLIILSQSVHAAEQPGSDDDLHDAEAKALASLRLHVPADALSERLLTVLPRALFSGGAPEDDPDLSQYLVFGQGGQLYVLGRRQKTIWSIHPTTGKIEVVYRDVRPGLLDFTDFTLLQNGLLALADQPRQAVYLFQQRRFWKGLGLLNDRWLFPSPRAVCTNDDRSLLGVIDSARNRSFVFSQTGQLLSELSGPTEACFFQNELVQLQISGNRVHARVIKRGGSTDSLFTAETTPGNVWLDAQAIGAIGSTLVVIGRQGQGDEDHPAWSRVLVYRQGTVRSCSIIPHLGLHTGSPKSYTLLTVDGAQSLIDLDQHPEGIAVRAFRLP